MTMASRLLIVMASTAGAIYSSEAKLTESLQQWTADGKIVGAQVAIRRMGEETRTGVFGLISPNQLAKVDAKTQFLIASCSKPFASACVLSVMSEEGTPLALTSSVDSWLPDFGSLRVRSGGTAKRAPTVEELLCHRAFSAGSRKGSPARVLKISSSGISARLSTLNAPLSFRRDVPPPRILHVEVDPRHPLTIWVRITECH